MENKKKLKELKANMPYAFYEKVLEDSEKLGLTERQFTAICISLGYQSLLNSYLNNTSGFLSSDAINESAIDSPTKTGKTTLRSIVAKVREVTG